MFDRQETLSQRMALVLDRQKLALGAQGLEARPEALVLDRQRARLALRARGF